MLVDFRRVFPVTDSDLLLRIRDRSAVAELYDRHSPTLYAVALRILGEGAAATGVLEDLFLALWDGSERYDPHFGSPAAWLVRMARERALTRQAQTAAATVDEGGEPTPRLLVEQAFYRGKGVDELARSYSLTPDRVRAMLCAGMAEVRKQFRPGEWR